MNSLESSEDRIKCLKDTFIGETMYIVAAGPSLKTIDNNHLINFLKDKLTVSIKQNSVARETIFSASLKTWLS